MKKTEIDDIVTGIKEFHKTLSVEELLENMGIELKTIAASSVLLHGGNGVFVRTEKREIIYLSSSCPDELKNYTIAHELGHAVLHDVELAHCQQLYKSGALEDEADYFALRLLDPDWDITEVEGYSSDEVATMLGVSERSIKYLV